MIRRTSTVYTAVLGLLNTIDCDATIAPLEALARKATPVIQSHSTEAQSIRKQLTSAM